MESRLIFANYEAKEKVGEGGYGEIFIAENPISGDVRVIKTLQERFRQNPDVENMFIREAQIMAKLKHPNIAPVHNVGREPEPHLMTDYYRESLDDRLKEGGLGVEEAIDVQKQLLRALSYAHSKGVIHRDIKPENIMFDNGNVKLTDFGVALVVQQSREFKNLAGTVTGYVIKDSRKQKTTLDSIIGTFNYAAPEVREGKEATAQSDVYSAGKVFFEMLTGRQQEGLTLPSEINSRVSYELDIIVKKSIDPDLRRRYKSAQQMLNDLERIHIKSFGERVGDLGRGVEASLFTIGRTLRKGLSSAYEFFHDDMVYGSKKRTKWIGGSLLAVVMAYSAFTYGGEWLRTRPETRIEHRPQAIAQPNVKSSIETNVNRLAEYQQRFRNIKGLVIEREYDLAREMIGDLEKSLSAEQGATEKKLLRELREYSLNTKRFYVIEFSLFNFSFKNSGVYAENLMDGKEDKRLFREDDYSLIWSPDGRHMLLNPASSSDELFVADSNGTNLKQPTDSGGNAIESAVDAFWIDINTIGFKREKKFFCVDIDQFNNSHRYRQFNPEKIPKPVKNMFYDDSLVEILRK